MTGWDGKAFDRWLTTEPGETCAHAGTPCGKTCLCNCEACIEAYLANVSGKPEGKHHRE